MCDVSLFLGIDNIVRRELVWDVFHLQEITVSNIRKHVSNYDMVTH